MDPRTLIRANLKRVQQRMAEAAMAANRDPGDVRLIAVTKYVSASIGKCLIEAGVRTLGESRPQALWEKHAALSEWHPEWHLIGHLQTNKVRRTVALTDLHCIQSVDRLALIPRLESEAARVPRTLDVLLEARCSKDPTKHGLDEAALAAAVEQTLAAPHLRLRGLMAMSSLHAGDDQIRREFEQVREWQRELAERFDCADALRELSLGMSRDFEIGIACGATMVRIGSALFEGLPR